MNTAYVTPAAPLRAAVEALIDGGVRDVVICPGSRSTPMALALRAATDLTCWVHLDERAGSYFGLGAAKAGRRPVVVLATSGTAAVNFAPAVAEARYGRVPLVLLTADRPPELQGVGAPQTIDQVDLYGRHAKASFSLDVPTDSEESARQAHDLVSAALMVATTAPAGPVQVNLPFREPLVPAGPLAVASRVHAVRQPDPGVQGPPLPGLERVLDQLADATAGLIVCGPLDEPGFGVAIAALARATRLPILADGLSNVRSGDHDRSNVISRSDALLRSERFRDTHRPDLILHFGARPTSKTLDEWLEAADAKRVLVDAGGGWERPRGLRVVVADSVGVAEQLAQGMRGRPSAAEPEWLRSWQRADAAASAALEAWFERLDEDFEGCVPRALDAAMPDGVLILAGNSMPVREIDTFLPASGRRRRMLGNRGVNGIDGLLSTAFGAAVAQPEPVVAVIGDVSFLHDLNALVGARRLAISTTIVLVNNDGGGIFSFLPQASADRPDVGLPDHYEELFGTSHGVAFGPLVAALGARHQVVRAAALPGAISEAVAREGVDVLELRSDRARNVESHRAAVAVATRAGELAR
jgi:2-succinyl-5-enolpyruvyl-6-hydroxy-3-cyclohexene-1-carboxylate synthase